MFYVQKVDTYSACKFVVSSLISLRESVDSRDATPLRKKNLSEKKGCAQENCMQYKTVCNIKLGRRRTEL